MKQRIAFVIPLVGLAAVLGTTVLGGHGANAAQPPVLQNVQAAPEQPFTVRIECSSTVSFSCSENAAHAVPDGKRFVIQSVSAQGSATPPALVTGFEIGTQTGSQRASFSFVATEAVRNPAFTRSTTDTSSVTLYADGGTSILVIAHASESATNLEGVVYVSGYLVPMTG